VGGTGASIYAFLSGDNPVKYTDPDGRTAEYEIDEANKTVNIKVDIVIYGKDANETIAQEYTDRIMDKWGQDSSGNAWQMDVNGENYSVNFQVNVTVGKNPGFFKKLFSTLFGTNNYVKVDNRKERPDVWFGSSGTWITGGTTQRGGLSLNHDNIPAHEFGHLLGLRDRYTDLNGPDVGWEQNIMASTSKYVDQNNINAIRGQMRKNSGVIRSWFMTH
jgi:hypothetical protein